MSLLASAWRPALLLAALVAAGLALRWLGLEGYVEQAGQAGPLAFVGIAGLACGFGVPRQVVAYAGGLAFGFWPGSALALLAEGLACAGNFLGARLLARRWAIRWLPSATAGGGWTG